MISVNVLVDHKKWKKSLNKPQLFFDKILRHFPKKYFFSNKKVNFTLLLSNNTNIKKLNNKFRKKNNHTDVLSFPSFIKTDLKKELKKKEIYLGDIIISYQYIFPNKQNSILEKTFIHGFLHLLGFDHKKIKDFKIMNREENKILNSIS
ncbi:rRNA maturation RNase YbeY [Candidatus Pelagibacter communis]|uniref:rRNA maturation RNase YbeY n=1 Tax=Pelagibacter ubique TaxID=198252 RepID=UPI000A3F2632|nr:rRNA maturation RNase YbeY [Candidatus Pelagibacter ubique]